LIRALEVQRLSGKSFSNWHRDNQPPPWCNPMIIGLERPRQELREIINLRTRKMIENSWLDEVRELLSHYFTVEDFPPPAREAVGYRLLADVISNKISLEDATVLIVHATRQFAKRQMTWFRANKQTEWLMGYGSDAPMKWATEIVERWGSFDQNLIEVC
jgi:tRNA dimethylallyltransferase